MPELNYRERQEKRILEISDEERESSREKMKRSWEEKRKNKT